MPDLFDQLQELILSPIKNRTMHEDFRSSVRSAQAGIEGVEYTRAFGLSRLSHAYEHLDLSFEEKKRTGIADFVAILRQVIRSYERPMQLRPDIWQTIRDRAVRANLHPWPGSEGSVVIHAHRWSPEWLPNSDDFAIDSLNFLRNQTSAIGDGLLSAMTGGSFSSYRSDGQKRAIDAAFFAKPGCTLLVSLPTGGGKSMCILLPAWQASQGGHSRNGTSLVIVPTVSLAIDLQKQSLRYFSKAAGPAYRPQALVGDTPVEIRKLIYQGIDEGTLPILFTSPEALLNGRILYDKVILAARNQSLNWLIIDEAHVVETWGNQFRTEFQLLSTFRRKLMRASKGRLKTLLLSATITDECEVMLKTLFSEDDGFISIHANQLRPEISYWFSKARSEDERRMYVLDALFNLPRPAILYVTKPSQAQEWVEYLRDQGFLRLAAFSGLTKQVERRSIMRDWDRDERDLIIATSAFGLGVNKEDVRTVIHASLPENLDRYYQEVGRGGRDGCSSVSLVCASESDYEVARQMTTRTHIGQDKAWGRWQAMWKSSLPVLDRGDERYFSLNTKPLYNPEMVESRRHSQWNEHVLLLMQRAELLEIMDTQPPGSPEEAELKEGAYVPRDVVGIRVLRGDITSDHESFNLSFEPCRTMERQSVLTSLDRLTALVNNFSNADWIAQGGHCISNEFAATYPNVALACGGCPSCRERHSGPYVGLPEIEMHATLNQFTNEIRLQTRYSQLFSNSVLNATWHGDSPPTEELASLIEVCLSIGFKQFIVPDELFDGTTVHIERRLSKHSRSVHRLLTNSLIEEGWMIYRQPSVVVYSLNRTTSDDLYQTVNPVLGNSIPMINIVNRGLQLTSLHGRFVDRVNGVQWTTNSLLGKLTELRDTL